MDDWSGLRAALTAVAWITVGGGALMAVMWFARGGARALGPEDDDMAGTSPRLARRESRVTSFQTAQVLTHGLLGIMTAAAVTYGATLDDDRTGGYVALIGAVALTAIPGLLMFRKWRARERPLVAAAVAPADPQGGARPGARSEPRRVEDRLPRPVVLLHGIAALGTAALLVVLLVVD